MGIECSMWQMRMSRMEQLLCSDEAFEEFIDTQFPDPDSEEEEARRQQDPKYSVDPEDDGIWLGKAWHLLHYLITGTEDDEEFPLAYAIMVGHPIEGVGGEFCWLSPEEVKEVARALGTISKEDLKKRSTKGSISKVDPFRWPNGATKKEREELLADFANLKRYYRDAARKGNAMLRLIS